MARICKQTRKYNYTGNPQSDPKSWLRVSRSLMNAMDKPQILQASDNTWLHPDNKHKNSLILSDGNSKVSRHGKRRNMKSYAYGKSTILSCPFAGSCIRYCYQNLNNYTGSMRMHGHNYHMVYTRSQEFIYTAIVNAIENATNNIAIIRLNDNGDFMSLNEIMAWLQIASERQDIVFYGYTKNSPHLHKARTLFGQFPSNFRVSLSDLNENDPTSEKWTKALRNDFPGEFRICRIIDTSERDNLYNELPWNDEEIQAFDYTQDFKIALHINQEQFSLCNDDEIAIENKYSNGENSDGVKFC